MPNTMFFSLLLNIGLLVLIATLLTHVPFVRRLLLNSNNPVSGQIALALIFGVILLVNYFSVVIYYDDEKFLYKTLRGGKKEFHYGQIRGQRSLMTRGGINTILFVGDEEINLYSSMQNLNAFLNKAFYRWCAAKGIDPDSVENNPRMFTWFPDPEKPAKT